MSEESQDLKNEVEEPLPWEHGEGAALVLGEMNLTGDEKVMLVSCKVERFTVESKVQPQAYEMARGYAELVPQDLWVHLPIHDPGKLVNEGGNVKLLGKVFKTIARELDLAVFNVASERVDRKVAVKDAEAAQNAQRFDAGTVRKEVVAAQKTGESL